MATYYAPIQKKSTADPSTLEGLLQLAQQPQFKKVLEQYQKTKEPKLSLLQRVGEGLGAFNPANAVYQSKYNRQPFLRTYAGDIGKGLASAFTGKEYTAPDKKYFKDVLVRGGMPDRPGKIDLADIAGLGLDIFADPSTYLGGKVLTKGAEGLMKGAKLATRLPGVGPIIADVGRGLEKAFTSEFSMATKALRKTPSPELKKFADTFDTLNLKLFKHTPIATKKQLDILSTIGDGVEKKFGASVIDDMFHSIDTGKKLAVPELDSIVANIKNTTDDWFREEARRGFFKEGSLSYIPNYVRRTLTPEARKVLQEIPSPMGIPKPIRQKLNFAISRKTSGTAKELNAAWKAQYGHNLFETNIFKAYAYRLIEHNNAIALDDFFNGVKKAAEAVQTDEFAKHGIPLAQSTAKNLKGVDLPRDIAGFIDKTASILTHDETTSEFLKFVDRATNIWKGTVYGWLPSSHTTNAIGGLFHNYVAGAVNPSLYTTSEAVLGKGAGVFDTKAGRITFDQIRKMLDDFGVIGETGYLDVPANLRIMPGETASKIAKMPQQLMGQIENRLRVPLFLDGLQKGMTPLDAAKRVMKYHFDYTPLGLSGFERTVMKRLIPFYTFSRNAIPLTIEQLIKQPGKYAALYKAQRATGAAPSTEEQRFAPEYLRNQFLFKGGDKLVSGFKIPAEEAFQKLEKPLRGFATSLTPWLKIPIELVTGKNIYRDKDIQDDTDGSQYKAVPQVLKNFLEYTEVKIPKNEKTGSGGYTKYYVNPKKKYIIENFPFTSRAWNVAVRVSQGKEDKRNLLPIITAIKTYDISPQRQEDAYTNKLLHELQSTLERLGGGYEYKKFVPQKGLTKPPVPYFPKKK